MLTPRLHSAGDHSPGATMALIALFTSTAFAITFPTKSPPTWCATPHERELVTYISPGWPTEPTSEMSATHIKAYDGEHCLVFTDLSTYMYGTSVNGIDPNDILGIVIEVDHHTALTECTLAAESNRCDWQIDTKMTSTATKLFPFPTDLLVISGLRETSVVTITLMKIHIESTVATCSGSFVRDGKQQFECSAPYSYKAIETQSLLGNGTKSVKRAP